MYLKFVTPMRSGLVLALTLFTVLTGSRAQGTELSLSQAVALAQQFDPWLTGSQARERALLARGVAAEALPDPMLSIGMANLPTDTFEFGQEAMTQFKVGLTQVLPRGDSRTLNARQLQELGAQQGLSRIERSAQVEVTVTSLWLEAWRARQSVRLIERDRALFEQLVDIAQSRYASALGGTRQQDVVRAQLELTRLDDRLTTLHQQAESAHAQLLQWLFSDEVSTRGIDITRATLPMELPDAKLQQAQLIRGQGQPDINTLSPLLLAHPTVRKIDAGIRASDTGVDLARQAARPQWQLSASYGYRDDTPAGMDRADFLSFGVNVDLPTFSRSRQDKLVEGASAEAAAARTQRSLALRELMASFHSLRAQLLRLEQRQALYEERLRDEVDAQFEAALSAYTHDDGDFAEVVRSRIDTLNTDIELLALRADRLKTITQLNYLMSGSSPQQGSAHDE